nr:ribonuclease H-like domain-containing protein [Tanacetum cinerariifolium]
MAIPEDHLAKFHKMTDANEMWEAIKSRFGGNDESKKMQKYILKQQFESFSVSNSEGLHKGCDRSLPSSWSQVSLIMRTKPGVDTLSFDDLYNNIRVVEFDVKGSSGSSSSTQNVAFVFSDNTSSTNEVNNAYGVSTFSGHNSQREGSSSYTDELMYSFFANQSRHFARECRSKENQESRRRDAGNIGHKARDNVRRPAKQDKPKAMVTIDGEDVDWTGHAEDDTEDYALMAFSSSNSGSDTEMSAKDKFGLGYGTQIHEGVLSYKNEVLESVFESRPSDIKDSPVNDRFTKVEGKHAVPPLMTGIYMPLKSDFGIDESKFTYGAKQSKNGESDAKTSDLASCDSNSSVETLKYVPKLVESKPKAVSEPKVWSDSPITEEYESDSDDEYQDTCSQNPKVDKRDWTGLKTKRQGLGYSYTRKACFVCGSFSYLIKDCDLYEKRMAKQVKLNNNKNKVNCHRNDRPVRNNVQRMNHNNKFVPKAILTKTGRFLVNAVRQKFSSQSASTSTFKKVTTARQMVNDIIPRDNLFKSHAPIGRPFNRTIAPKANFTNHKVNNAGNKTVSIVGGNKETAVKASAGCNWRSKIHYWNKVSKYNRYPHQTLKRKGIIDSGCSRHMTRNKAYLVEYQGFNGGHVAFGGSKGQITDTKFLVLSPDFKLPDENQVLLRVPRQHNMYSFNLEHIVLSGGGSLNRFWCYNVDFIKGLMCVARLECFLCEMMLMISSLSTAEAVSTACYVLNRILVTKPQNMTPYELLTGNSQMEAEHVPKYFILPLWSSYTSTVKCSTTKNGDKKLNEDIGSKTNKEPVDQEDQAFLKELEKLKRQEKKANDATETFRKTTPVNTANTSVKTASLSRNVNVAGLSSPDLLTYANQDDSYIPSLEDIYVVCWVLIIINPLYLTTVSFGVDAAMDLEEKH